MIYGYTLSLGCKAICQYSNVIIFGTEGTIEIPLRKIGCVGEVGPMVAMHYIDGKTHDLSGYGVHFSNAVTLTCATKNETIQISVNGKVVGTQVKFNGTGSVDQFEIRDNKLVHQR